MTVLELLDEPLSDHDNCDSQCPLMHGEWQTENLEKGRRHAV